MRRSPPAGASPAVETRRGVVRVITYAPVLRSHPSSGRNIAGRCGPWRPGRRAGNRIRSRQIAKNVTPVREDSMANYDQSERRSAARRCRSGYADAVRPARQSCAQRTQVRVRSGAMRRLHHSCRRRAVRSCVLPIERAQGPRGHHAGRAGNQRETLEAPAGFHRRAGGAVRLLRQRHDHDLGRASREEQKPERIRNPRRRSPAISAAAAPINASSPPSSARPRPEREADMTTSSARISFDRREFLKASGILAIGF